LAEYLMGGPIDNAELDAWCLDSPWVEMNVPNEDVDSYNDL
jgi:hypothetical protein